MRLPPSSSELRVSPELYPTLDSTQPSHSLFTLRIRSPARSSAPYTLVLPNPPLRHASAHPGMTITRFIPPYLPKKESYVPTHPELFLIHFGSEEDYSSCLIAQQVSRRRAVARRFGCERNDAGVLGGGGGTGARSGRVTTRATC